MDRPAEPVVSLCEALERAGLDVRLAFRSAPPDFTERTVGKEAGKRGISFYDGFRLNRYFSPGDWFFDFRAIRRYAVEQGIDIIHSHLTHDHAQAALSLAGHADRPLLVRTDHKRDGLDPGFTMGMLLRATDGLAAYGERIRVHDVQEFGFPGKTVAPPASTSTMDRPRTFGDLLARADGEDIGVIG
jgi:hypothetical protein